MEIKENLVRKQGVRKGVLAYIDPPLKFPPPFNEYSISFNNGGFRVFRRGCQPCRERQLLVCQCSEPHKIEKILFCWHDPVNSHCSSFNRFKYIYEIHLWFIHLKFLLRDCDCECNSFLWFYGKNMNRNGNRKMGAQPILEHNGNRNLIINNSCEWIFGQLS